MFASLYLKQAAVCLQKAYAGVPQPKSQLPVPVSLTGSGLPRIIPSYHRKLILKKDERADTFVKIYLSYFSLCRAIRLAKRVDRSILKKSIVSPVKDVDRVENAISQFICHVPKLLHRYWKRALTIPMYQGITWEPTWKAIPSDGGSFWKDKKGIFLNLKEELEWFLAYELYSDPRWVDCDFAEPGFPLWFPYVRYALDRCNTEISLWSMRASYPIFQQQFEGNPGGIPKYGSPGRLAQSTESGAGKRRIFAIGNYINLRLLKPLHDWKMSALATLPMDGTYNQLSPLVR